MNRRFLVAALAVIALVVVGTAIAAEKEFKATCPVSGGPAKDTATISFLGKDLAFCCNNCPKKFEADSEKFAAKAHHQLLGTGQITQVACPFSGRDLNADTAIEVAGVDVAFCCNNCKGKAEKSDDAVALVFGDLEKGFTLQTKCPISGKPIKVDTAVSHNDKNVYFCCGGCPAKFEANPEEYTAKLPQFSEAK